ncbi:MAG: glycosyltransferase family 2 protein [Bacteroidetes bacterium]|nr:glycosyltransferase family 2 protein [Bacteroidota bacterium]
MTTFQKTLSITIPTWNRSVLITGLLDQICDQVISDKIENDVELLISNNGSDDNTENSCLAYRNKFNFITYHNNGRNIGARDNVLKCFELASGKYIILFGDDDRIQTGAIKQILHVLRSNTGIDLILVSSNLKSNPFSDGSFINLLQLVENFYYNIGNAGLFIYKVSLAKNVLAKHQFSDFNKSWPQTQLMVLGIEDIHKSSCLITEIKINAPGLHEQVMVYSSYYLYRTTFFDLIDSIESIKHEIDHKVYISSRSYLSRNLSQVSFNILQCGIFVDDTTLRIKTRKHIFSNLKLFNTKEKMYMSCIASILYLPTFLSKPLSDIFIFILKGRNGLIKKNKFVLAEKQKKSNQLNSKSNEIREFSF